MSLFGTILEKLGIKKPVTPIPPVTKEERDARSAPPAQVTPATPASVKLVNRDSRPVPPPATPAFKVYADSAHVPDAFKAAPPPTPMPMVDVVGKLEKMAHDKGEKLNWKASIVDLLKVLGIDSSLEARKELAVELGCPPEKMKDSVNMNIWLHKTVLAKIAENGGNIPKELLN
jgi:hypothetical protein